MHTLVKNQKKRLFGQSRATVAPTGPFLSLFGRTYDLGADRSRSDPTGPLNQPLNEVVHPNGCICSYSNRSFSFNKLFSRPSPPPFCLRRSVLDQIRWEGATRGGATGHRRLDSTSPFRLALLRTSLSEHFGQGISSAALPILSLSNQFQLVGRRFSSSNGESGRNFMHLHLHPHLLFFSLSCCLCKLINSDYSCNSERWNHVESTVVHRMVRHYKLAALNF